MAKISDQLRQLKKQIKIPWKVKYIDYEIDEKDFEPYTIYIHIWI